MENLLVLQVLTAMAVKLGTTVEYLWGILVKQAVVDSVTNIVMWVILSVITYIAVKFFKKLEDKNPYSDLVGYISITTVVVLAVLWIAVFFSIPSTINGFVNPEYEALREVLDVIKPASD